MLKSTPLLLAAVPVLLISATKFPPVPLTSRVLPGSLVPIPIFPSDLMRSLSVALTCPSTVPVAKAIYPVATPFARTKPFCCPDNKPCPIADTSTPPSCLNLIDGLSLSLLLSLSASMINLASPLVPDETVKVLPSKVKFDSPSNVFAVPEPVITLLSALLLIVVPDTVVQVAALPEPPLVNTCPDVP